MANRNQNIETPWPFIRAVENLFWIKFNWDLAASDDNHKAPHYFTEEDNALEKLWPTDGWCWLNPPFGKPNLTKWVEKCREESENGCKIISIWPLSGDRNQMPAWKYSDVFVIHGRVWPEVRGCMLCRWVCYPGKKSVGGLTWDGKELKRVWE